ncbi:hypothetical protein ACFFV7_14400 [Nonomuraea spiralis]|uniref:Uncharacterized protein n=1 Tax=Nonomuraea spiralis TaxID=46182 RepID=A0ABV5ICX5_9ACTN|nr:hypothetical protein [Nonomuraea spiralis]GGT20810.1 hypothetical protein GCM10010176_076720 [Nonomuraea spiralis]
MTATRRGRLAAGVALAGLALAGVTLFAVHQESARLDQELAAQVTLILERATPEEHQGHGHGFESRVVCAVEPFGMDPPDASSLVEVRRVYARHLCAIVGESRDWAMSVRASGPIAVRLGVPPRVEVPAAGPGYPERVRRLIPERYHDEAFAEFSDETAIDAARERFAHALDQR